MKHDTYALQPMYVWSQWGHSQIFCYPTVVKITMAAVNSSAWYCSHSDAPKTCHREQFMLTTINSFFSHFKCHFCPGYDQEEMSLKQTGNQFIKVRDKNLETNTWTQFYFKLIVKVINVIPRASRKFKASVISYKKPFYFINSSMCVSLVILERLLKYDSGHM